MTPDVPKRTDTRYQRLGRHKLSCKRAGIEPTIGHLKSDHCLGRNFYKGVTGDSINVLLAAAAYNFKRAMKALLWIIENNQRDAVGTRRPAETGFLRIGQISIFTRSVHFFPAKTQYSNISSYFCAA